MEIPPNVVSTSVNPRDLRDIINQRRSSRMTDIFVNTGTRQPPAFSQVQPASGCLPTHLALPDPKSSGEHRPLISSVHQEPTSVPQANCAAISQVPDKRRLLGEGSENGAPLKKCKRQKTGQCFNDAKPGKGDISVDAGAPPTVTSTDRQETTAFQNAATAFTEKRRSTQDQIVTSSSDVLNTNCERTPSVSTNEHNKNKANIFQTKKSNLVVSNADRERILREASRYGLYPSANRGSTNGQPMNAVTVMPSSLQAAQEMDMNMNKLSSTPQQSNAAAMQIWATPKAVPPGVCHVVSANISQNQQKISANTLQMNSPTLTRPRTMAPNAFAAGKYVPSSTHEPKFVTSQHVPSDQSTITQNTNVLNNKSSSQHFQCQPVSTDQSLVFRKFGCTSLPHVLKTPHERVIPRNVSSELVLQKWGSIRASHVSRGFTPPGQTTTPSPFAQEFVLPSQTIQPSPFAQQTVPLTGYTIPQSPGHKHANPNALIAVPSVNVHNVPQVEGELIPYNPYVHHSLPRWRPNLPPGSDCYSVITAESPLSNLCVGQKYIRKETIMEWSKYPVAERARCNTFFKIF